MRKLIFIVLTSLFVCNTALAQNRKAAIYNNKLFALQHEVGNKIIRFFEVVKTGDITKIMESHDSVNKSIDAMIAKVSKFKQFEGDNSLKEAVLVWMKGYEESFENEYKQMLPLLSKKDRSAEENSKLNQMHDDLIKEEMTFDQKLAETQKTFAEKHKLILGNGE
jgi:hypothetical protein